MTCPSFDETKIQAAVDFATLAHKGQTRKWTGEPYIEHPLAVMATVRVAIGREHAMGTACASYDRDIATPILCAAVLHDVVEDCDVKLQTLHSLFGFYVWHYVDGLTDATKDKGNRAARVKLNCERLASQPTWVQGIKCADIMSNVPSVVKHDPKFARTYVREKLQALDVLDRAPASLRIAAREMVQRYASELMVSL